MNEQESTKKVVCRYCGEIVMTGRWPTWREHHMCCPGCATEELVSGQNWAYWLGDKEVLLDEVLSEENNDVIGTSIILDAVIPLCRNKVTANVIIDEKHGTRGTLAEFGQPNTVYGITVTPSEGGLPQLFQVEDIRSISITCWDTVLGVTVDIYLDI